MSDITGTTRAQTLFLRAYAKNPAGPPPSQWPAPAILRKWMRKPRFRHALQQVQPHRKVRGLLYYLRRDHPEYFSNNPPPILIHPTT